MPATLLEDCTSELAGAATAIETGHGIVSAMHVSGEAQVTWAGHAISDRLRILKRARHLLAIRVEQLCAAISPDLARNPVDTRVAEILPLLAACKFLEDNAAKVLAPRRLRRNGRPFWLTGVSSEVQRIPMGRVLVIAPSNYPLFLPGVQVLQALAAGNAAIWKPGSGGGAVAHVFASIMRDAGLPEGVLQVTDESIDAAQAEIARGVDKVFFSGSASSGRILMRQLAETLTPCVAELSGCDAVFVLPSADLPRVIKALAFGMRLNGSATCMAPRRVIVVGADADRRTRFMGLLLTVLDCIPGVRLSERIQRELHILLEDALTAGAQIHGELEPEQQPLVLTGVTAKMRIASADIFAPVLSVIDAPSVEQAIAMYARCPYSLTASIFGDEPEARALAGSLVAGTVLINDLIVPTADPRVPFGGRRNSGFGATRGAEGLIEMTAPRVISTRRGGSTRHYDATTTSHEDLFDGVIEMSHAATWKARFSGLAKMVRAARNLGRKK